MCAGSGGAGREQDGTWREYRQAGALRVQGTRRSAHHLGFDLGHLGGVAELHRQRQVPVEPVDVALVQAVVALAAEPLGVGDVVAATATPAGSRGLAQVVVAAQPGLLRVQLCNGARGDDRGRRQRRRSGGG